MRGRDQWTLGQWAFTILCALMLASIPIAILEQATSR